MSRDCRRILHALSARDLVAGVDAAENGKVAAGLFADVFDDEPRKAHPVFKAAAKLVRAVVGALGNKRADKIAVGAVDLDHVDPGQLGASGRVAVALR